MLTPRLAAARHAAASSPAIAVTHQAGVDFQGDGGPAVVVAALALAGKL